MALPLNVGISRTYDELGAVRYTCLGKYRQADGGERQGGAEHECRAKAMHEPWRGSCVSCRR
jgi:hypothetical protein